PESSVAPPVCPTAGLSSAERSWTPARCRRWRREISRNWHLYTESASQDTWLAPARSVRREYRRHGDSRARNPDAIREINSRPPRNQCPALLLALGQPG